jgi:hypothetical protein
MKKQKEEEVIDFTKPGENHRRATKESSRYSVMCINRAQ